MITDNDIENEILRLAIMRGNNKTFCPSEVARNLEVNNWRILMHRVRHIADKLKLEKKIKILQKGKTIHSAIDAIGPIRLKSY